MHRIYATPVADVYQHYVTKIEKKGRSREELDAVITWLTGFSQDELERHLTEQTTFQDFFAAAPMTEHTDLITGVVCGVRVEEVEDPLMQQIRWMDKLVDELARGKALDKVIRAA